MSIVIEIHPNGAHVACGNRAIAERAAALARVEHPRHTFTVRNLSRIPAQPVAQVGTHAGIGPALPHEPAGVREWPDGAGPSLSDSMLRQPPSLAASDSSAPPRARHDFGGADDLLEIPAFLRRTADNRVPV